MAAATPAPFSRLQLAAALLEYDNDATNPDAPGNRSAHESAIFANFRRGRRKAPRKNDYLSVALPSDAGSLGGRESAMSGRRSLHMMRNPFGATDESGYYDDDEDELDEEQEELQVDLSSWGLDAFMSKAAQEAKTTKRRSRTATLPNPHAHPVGAPLRSPTFAPETANRTTRSMSVGNLEQMTSEIEAGRRKSMGAIADTEPVTFQRARSASHSLVPFPTTSVRSPSPPLAADDPAFTSKFDPRLSGYDADQRDRRMSVASMTSRYMNADDNPFALRPPTAMSKFDPKAATHARTMSNASMGTRAMLDDASVMTGGDRRYSTMELLRPKILVMPSPLQTPSGAAPPTPGQTREGFETASDPPLPPGARAARRTSTAYLEGPPSTSNFFTPNPRNNLTLSQLTFRNTLLVGGQRDVTYSDIDDRLPRAMEDGEQVQQTMPLMEDEFTPMPTVPSEDPLRPGRPAGKLFGKSLIDDLENRKSAMRSRQRVFTGDARPSMMARDSAQRRSTLIDLQGQTDAQGRPLLQHTNSQQGINRLGSLNSKPLLNFDDEANGLLPPPGPNGRTPNSRSVFGVDTLWEREMAKLKEIEAKEKAEEDARLVIEAEAEAARERKRAKKKRKDGSVVGGLSPLPSPRPDSASVSDLGQPESRIASAPPVLPAISPGLRRPPPGKDDDSDSDDSGRDGPSQLPQKARDGWVSSDEEGAGPTRKPGTGPRYPNRAPKAPAQDDDSEEDLPLAATIDRAAQRATQLQVPGADSDEERPLSDILRRTKLSLPSINFDRRSQSNVDDEEDDQPLGLRASRVAPSFTSPSSHGHGDDDDMPLAFHPEQQRRSQFNMMAQMQQHQQQQQQQQQMMMQAQFTNSMFFSSPAMPMMGSGFFGPQMMMQSPPIAPLHDEAKFKQVDNWRQNIVVED
ncbi:hypothetical protein MKEN_00100800 [Mycena kentingensis (nom. inval.)]|nr:hypothetical protein MKEN_00100800 [Mycena kentingensis (nom. inval.)]